MIGNLDKSELYQCKLNYKFESFCTRYFIQHKHMTFDYESVAYAASKM